ncbi:YetF domain-containing protein [Bradyrhizobium sp. 23]|uniref:DUF421 domain-containing protein n=2 Tax=Bradyrhizobium TaxID=374 RepID=UPI001FFBACDD|nr:YetF domain-containing protein [Bradyrhizobium sp. 23]MCK1317309.1 DUF421 domain-containing protein [Bradyrhizobium sp. 23]
MAEFAPSWQALIHTAVAAVLSYFVIIILIRAFGQRALAKWNAFGFIVTIALGSAMATGILSARVSILQSTLAFALLLGLQLMFATIYTRWPRLRVIFNPPPELVFRHGKFIASKMKRHRIAEQDVRAAVRSRGIDRIEDVDAVVLESNGSLSVLKSVHSGASALLDVRDDERPS